MKLKIMDGNRTEKGSKDLPSQFSEPVRFDLIQRSVLSIQAATRQAYGTDPEAGQRHAAQVSKRRRDYKTTYGHGISRVPRKVLSRSGTQFNWVGAKMPGTVGGRSAHPPKTDKVWTQKVNEKENRMAIRSAIAATVVADLVKKRGHRIPKEFPFILDNKIESATKTKDVAKTLDKLGFAEELERTSVRKVRAGKGKNRGRKLQNKIGPLFVVSKECALAKAARNIPGVDVCLAKNLNAELLAPGCHPGRLTLWTEEAIDALHTQKLFTEDYKGQTEQKEIKTITPLAKKPAVKTTKPALKKVAAKKSA